MRFTGYLGVLCMLVAGTGAATAQTAPTKNQQIYSYAVGLQVGQGLRDEGVEVDLDVFAQAVRDSYGGEPPRYTPDAMRAAVDAYREEWTRRLLERAERNQGLGETYLAANRKKQGVVETPSGLQYRIVRSGSTRRPAPEDSVLVNYRGTRLDGSEFDSSYRRGGPLSVSVEDVIKGWREVLPMMGEGARWEVVIPPQLAYGLRGTGSSIGPNETLIFDIEVVEIRVRR